MMPGVCQFLGISKVLSQKRQTCGNKSVNEAVFNLIEAVPLVSDVEQIQMLPEAVISLKTITVHAQDSASTMNTLFSSDCV